MDEKVRAIFPIAILQMFMKTATKIFLAPWSAFQLEHDACI